MIAPSRGWAAGSWSGASDGFVEVEQDAGEGGPRFERRGGGFSGGIGWGRLQLAEKIEETRALGGGGRTGDTETKRVIETRGVIGSAFALDASGERAGELKKLEIIEERERLERRVGTESARARAKTIGCIEHRDGGMRGRAPMVRVESAAVAVGAGAGDPGAFGLTEVHDAVGLGREDRRAAKLRLEETAGGEGDVADEFGVEAETVLAGEKFVERVGEIEVGSGQGSALISSGSDDETVDGLHAPVLGGELRG